MFRSTHIRTKLAVALVVPLAALAVVGGLAVLGAKTQVDRANSEAHLAAASIGPGSVVVQLQEERNQVYAALVGGGGGAQPTAEARAEVRRLTDDAATAFRQDTSSRGGVVRSAFDPAWAALDGLAEIRGDVDGQVAATTDGATADDIFQRYTDLIDTFFAGTSQVALSVDDASLRHGAELVDAATRQSEIQARIVRSIVKATAEDTLGDPLVGQEVAALFDRSQQIDEVIVTEATGDYAGVAEATFADPSVQSFDALVAGYLDGGSARIAPLLGALASDGTAGYAGLRTRAADILSVQAVQLQDDALARQALFGGIALAGLVLTVLITWLASRSITRPLRSLREQAEDMAGTRLPAAVRQILDTPSGEDVVMPDVQPITVKAKDEVSHVAAALSEVQASAVDLAVEQAVLRRNIADSYINLGRRNQNLLSRQIDLITDLERNETDPDALEGLFRLDHLATRMRRNAESLLVLAGIEPPRQWSAPVRAVDVVRAALGEVEDYKRVVVAHLEPASVTGPVAAEIAHVLAELVENALTFSPPEQPVEVNARLTTDGYAFTITDNGFGMPVEDLQRANRRLAGEESFTVAPSRYLGHYVAGHLASRLGIAVELQAAPSGGVLAQVTVPLGLVADDEFDQELAKAPEAEIAGAPSSSGPSSAMVTSETTPSGLPRRGDRSPSPAPDPGPALEPVAPLAPPAPPPPAAEPLAPAEPAPHEPAVAPHPVVAASSAGSHALPSIGGLPVQGPSLYTLTVNPNRTPPTAQAGNPAAIDDDAPSGLVRRVPGAQRPDVPVTARDEQPEPEEPDQTTPEDVYAFLSSFQSGVDRGRADASSEIAEEERR